MNARRGKQTGHQLRRVVYLLSGNPHKSREFAVAFDRYGIEVLRAPVSDNPLYLHALFDLSCKGTQVIAVHREQNALYDIATGGELTAPWCAQRAQRVLNMSTLRVTTRGPDGEPRHKVHTASRSGVLNPKKRSQDPNVFGWDDLFVPLGLANDLTYFELRQRGHKVSPRDSVVGAYITEAVHYQQNRDFRFTPLQPQDVVDFSNPVADYVERVPHYNLPTVKEYGLRGMLDHVLNQGIHWRAAKNRRAGTYWFPGMNAGIPLTPKGDAFHEETYLFHDFGHFVIRDLIFTGSHTAEQRQVYILYRMMSEAMTMVLADMLFVDAVARSGFEYDFSKRHIYPLFAATGVRFDSPSVRWESLAKLLRANVDYCVRGSTAAYQALLDASPVEAATRAAALQAFTHKYEPFFVEDFNWTDHNYRKMSEQSATTRQWWQHAAPVAAWGGVTFETVEAFIQELRPADGDLVDQVREAIVRKTLAPLFAEPVRVPQASRQDQLRAAFARYMAGQIGIFSRYGTLLAETPIHRDRLLRRLKAVLANVTQEGVQEIRALYDDYLTLLLERGLITTDDRETYKEVYPLFDPLYLSCDRDKASYSPLAEVSRKVLAMA